jgi:outer membrane protein TolC
VLNSGLFTTGIEYSIPLDQRITHEKRLTANRQLDLLGTQRDFEMEQITEQVRSAYRRVESARASLEILAQNKVSAENNLRIANRMMEVGRGSSRDVLDAQLSVTEVDSSILSAKTDFFLATIDLKRTMGEDITTMEFK